MKGGQRLTPSTRSPPLPSLHRTCREAATGKAPRCTSACVWCLQRPCCNSGRLWVITSWGYTPFSWYFFFKIKLKSWFFLFTFILHHQNCCLPSLPHPNVTGFEDSRAQTQCYSWTQEMGVCVLVHELSTLNPGPWTPMSPRSGQWCCLARDTLPGGGGSTLSSCLQYAAVFVCIMQQGFQRIISYKTRTGQANHQQD